MLVIISDLHFVDGTAGKHNLPTGAFESVLFSNVVSLARSKNAKEIKLVLLGDIMDVLRSEQWFMDGFDLADRPWGSNGLGDVEDPQDQSKTAEQCLKILGRLACDNKKKSVPKDTILHENWDTFKFFRDFGERVKREIQRDIPVEIIYVPGNHDRLCNLYPSLRDEVKKLLGLTVNEETVSGDPNGEWWYPYDFTDQAYGVHACHGHKYDPWNYGGGSDQTRKGHIQASIGDAITTEFVVKIPYKLASLKGKYPKITAPLVEKVKDIDNVRPTSQVMEWLYYRIREVDEVSDAIDETLDDVINDLLKVKFVQQWRSPQTHWDEAIRIMGSGPGRWLSRLVTRTTRAEKLLPMLMSMRSGDDPEKDRYAHAAYNSELWRRDRDIRFIVYGHTHSPVQRPLDGEGRHEVMYINTGTWRERIHRTIGLDKAYDFISLKQITYTIFYRADEDTNRKEAGTVSFEAWTGAKKKYYQ